MTFEDYVKFVRQIDTSNGGTGGDLEYLEHGLISEIGEVADLRKLYLHNPRHKDLPTHATMLSELGDVLWHMVAIYTHTGNSKLPGADAWYSFIHWWEGPNGRRWCGTYTFNVFHKLMIEARCDSLHELSRLNMEKLARRFPEAAS